MGNKDLGMTKMELLYNGIQDLVIELTNANEV